MSEAIKHECGIAFIRLLKPLDFFREKYGSAFFGLNKLCLLMEKQHNRGQDGAGIATVKLDVDPGFRYVSLERSNHESPIKDIFKRVNNEISGMLAENPKKKNNIHWLKHNVRFCGELYLGHLRYGTFGRNSIDACHPFIRENNWMTRTLITAGNFNLTNVDTLFRTLVGIGQHPIEYSDTVTVLEKIGHFLDDENTKLYRKYRSDGYPREEISRKIAKKLDILSILKNACRKWDGGYTICGMLGHGDAFVMRDPSGIRPAYYYTDDEIAVVTSERPPIQTAFNVNIEDVKEIPPGNAFIVRRDGKINIKQFVKKQKRQSCSFERIYFSRGSDRDIYRERKNLGKRLVPAVLKTINDDIENTVFSYIPNTAETCFFGMLEELNCYCQKKQLQQLLDKKSRTEKELEKIISFRPRFEKVAIKDAKLRTFITDDSQRNELAAHVYDITYGVIRPKQDNLVVIDDSIVRGTTMRESILRILDRTQPKMIIVVSSAPQIRYPDCYGIDMARLGKFIAFEAAIALLNEEGMENVISATYDAAQEQLKLPEEEMSNCVKDIYAPFTAEQISGKIGKMLTPKGMKAKVRFIYQTIEDLHKSCPEHRGDWYFTGNYPTPGGNKVVNQAFVNYIEGNNDRAY